MNSRNERGDITTDIKIITREYLEKHFVNKFYDLDEKNKCLERQKLLKLTPEKNRQYNSVDTRQSGPLLLLCVSQWQWVRRWSLQCSVQTGAQVTFCLPSTASSSLRPVTLVCRRNTQTHMHQIFNLPMREKCIFSFFMLIFRPTLLPLVSMPFKR